MVKRKAAKVSEEVENSSEEAPEEQSMDVKPIGEVIRKTGRGRSERKFYKEFELDGARYCLEDSVLVTPEEKSQKPYVAIIKEIKEYKDGSIAVTGQWFYRPEEAERKGGGSWVADDTRELFYSFHRDEVPAESVMHKCVVHFIPSHKKSPPRSLHPGFIVRKVYDTVEKKLWNLTDKDYEDAKQKEIDLLVQKTHKALGGLQDAEVEEVIAVTEKSDKPDKPVRRTLRRKTIPHPPALTVLKEEIAAMEEGGDTPGGKAEEVETPSVAKVEAVTPGADGDVNAMLRQMNVLTGNIKRDRWLEKIMSSIKSFYMTTQQEGSEAAGEKDPQFTPEQAVSAVSSLETAAYEALDERKFNLKMRSLEYNLRNGPVLARRLLAKELQALTVVNMTPSELKDGMTAAEKSAQEPEQPQTVQMADVRCALCGEPQVGVKDIINAPHGDRYQLECLKCGHSWYSARDSISSLTIGTVNPSPTVGIAPWATSKFEEVQKKIGVNEKGKEKEKEKEKESEAEEGHGDNKNDEAGNDDHNDARGAEELKPNEPVTLETNKEAAGDSEKREGAEETPPSTSGNEEKRDSVDAVEGDGNPAAESGKVSSSAMDTESGKVSSSAVDTDAGKVSSSIDAAEVGKVSSSMDTAKDTEVGKVSDTAMDTVNATGNRGLPS
ncbi:uncharacterized protein LOC9663265 isoform X1 [Selaginella moellendorffii]|uniref:uncharacterized protein LOC9663265 isoform X1 n=1 Tax=Selaginella moellendorffii TaxID=88036 RepID=UPI000D1CDAAF|nr:uncharacterized protein LOC9663265 isoform X1 [Selaginella moellendorffii]|eukprot:XP_024541990.1 uncharacterized protein LOC9663265 isoform X1 [Selaginella moellendorffii]